MIEKINPLDDHHMILVSRRMIFTVIGALLSLTFLLMLFFLHVDFDYLLGRKDLAMKVGQTTITLEELRQIQASLFAMIPIIGIVGTLLIVMPLMLITFVANCYEIYRIYSGERNRRWGDEFAGTIVAWE